MSRIKTKNQKQSAFYKSGPPSTSKPAQLATLPTSLVAPHQAPSDGLAHYQTEPNDNIGKEKL